MKTMKTSIMALTAAVMLTALGYADNARAAVKVRASVRTPVVRVHIGNRPSLNDYHMRVKLTKQDQRIARRLADYTGVRKNRLLRMRRMGYSWNEIGRSFEVPRRVVRAARSTRDWDRFLHRGRNHAGGGNRDHGRIWVTRSGCSCDHH